MKFKLLKSGLLSLILVLSVSTPAFALTAGGVGVSAYKSMGHCSHDNRAGAQLVSNFLSSVQSFSSGKVTSSFGYYDQHAWESDLLTASYTNIDDVDLAVFSGHGFVINGYDGAVHNSLHLFTLNSTTNFHTIENQNSANADVQEIWWGANGAQTKWVTTFSCNLLNSSDPKWNSIMGGVHLVLGFGRVMYLDSAQGTVYGDDLGLGTSFKDAFFNTNMSFQPKNDTPTLCRVLGAIASQYDNINYYSGTPSTIQSSPQSYSYWDVTVP